MAKQQGTGWAPYWYPMISFLLLVEVGTRAPESAAPWFLVLRAAVPGAFVLFYATRGQYPELRGMTLSPMIALDVAIGLLGAALWIAPFLVVDDLRPDEPGFDPALMGEGGIALAIGVRAIGYSIVTPFVEELFVRSWLLRFVDVFDKRRDFRNIPIARFTWRSFLVVTFYFVFTHVDWEWGVMLGWTLLTMGWFYYRRHLLPLVIVHAVTNGAILAFVALFDGVFTDAAGNPISLWFFI